MAPFDPILGAAALIFVDEFNLSPQSSGATLNVDVSTQTYNVMGDPVQRSNPTVPNFVIAHSGYYTGQSTTVAGYFEKVLYDRLGTITPVIVTFKIGEVAYTLESTWNQQLNFNAPVDGLITIEGNWSSPDAVYKGIYIFSGNHANNAVSTGVDATAASTYTRVVIHADNFADLTAGAETVTINVQTATTQGGSYTTWLSKVFKKPGVFIVTGAGNTNRWIRVQTVLTAGVPGPATIAVAALK